MDSIRNDVRFAVRSLLRSPPAALAPLVRAGVRLVVIGLIIGVPAAFAMGRGLGGMLYGVKGSDPATFVGIPVLLGAVALIASMVPALRATKVQPIVALRND